jgi:hypothetical protein
LGFLSGVSGFDQKHLPSTVTASVRINQEMSVGMLFNIPAAPVSGFDAN